MRVPGTYRLSYGPFDGRAGRRALLACGLLTGAALMAGCATKPVVTPVALTLAAGADVNPDARGRASPLTVRVYALKTPGAFESADFFSLFEKDQATLGAEMVLREEALLRPGERKQLALTLPADAKAIGVMAAFRDLDRARWREVRAVEAGKPLDLTVNFGARQIRIDAK
ncbi:MAG: type VI secretion system lipoprotein TssJ [Variovorax sp.]|nr:MAG: type VI secretion system lipoprotein TssJ [Variovorax sp.]